MIQPRLELQTPHPSQNPNGYVDETDIQSWESTFPENHYSEQDDNEDVPVGEGDHNAQIEGNGVGYDTKPLDDDGDCDGGDYIENYYPVLKYRQIMSFGAGLLICQKKSL